MTYQSVPTAPATTYEEGLYDDVEQVLEAGSDAEIRTEAADFYADITAGESGYPSEAREVVLDQSFNGEVANNNITQYYITFSQPINSDLIIRTLVVDYYNDLVSDNDLTPTIGQITAEHVDAYKTAAVPITFWGGYVFAAQNTSWITDATPRDLSDVSSQSSEVLHGGGAQVVGWFNLAAAGFATLFQQAAEGTYAALTGTASSAAIDKSFIELKSDVIDSWDLLESDLTTFVKNASATMPSFSITIASDTTSSGTTLAGTGSTSTSVQASSTTPDLILSTMAGVTLTGYAGDILASDANNTIFKDASTQGTSNELLMVGGSSAKVVTTGDVFQAGLAGESIMIGSSGSSEFDIDSTRRSSDSVLFIWGGGGQSTYRFTGDNDVVFLNIPNATTSEIASLNLAGLQSLISSIDVANDQLSISTGPLTVIIDPLATDVFELGSTVVKGGSYDEALSAEIGWGQPGAVDAYDSNVETEASQDVAGSSGTNLHVAIYNDGDSLRFMNFDNGTGGITLVGGSVANTKTTLAVAGQDGVQTATPSTPNLSGGGYNVTYVVNDTENTDGTASPSSVTIDNYSATLATAPHGVLSFGAGINPSDVVVTWGASYSDLAFYDVATQQGVLVSNGLNGTENELSSVQFADGTTWTYSQLLSDLTSATYAASWGVPIIIGDTSANVLDSQGLASLAVGNGGGDTFVYNVGYGSLELSEQDSSVDPTNTLQFGSGITEDEARLSADLQNVYVTVADGSPGDTIRIDGMSASSSEGVQSIEFADRTVWNGAEIAQMLATGTSGDDQLFGIAPGLTFDGKGGDDYEQGQGGGDTFVFDPGYGELTVSEDDTSLSPSNVLSLGTGIDASEVGVSISGNNLVLTDGTAGDQVTIDNMASGSSYGVQEVTFADGTVWTRSEIGQMLATGTPGNDTLSSIDPGQTYDGKGGDDYAQGQGGGDTFIFDPGYGQLTINEQDGGTVANRLAFGAGIDPSDVSISISGNNLVLTDGTVGDQVNLENMASGSNYGVQEVTFADGTVWTRSTIAQMLATGTSGNDTLSSIDPGQTYDGKGGNDYAQGKGAGDTFVFDPGYGQLEINENDYSSTQNNTLAFGTGIDPTAVQASLNGTAIVLTDGVSGDQVTLDNMASTSNSGVQNVTFADGTIWTRPTIAEMLVTGSTGNDDLVGIQFGLTYDGKGGDDYAQGKSGGDTFVFDPGYGQLEINENDYNLSNTLAFGRGIDPTDVQASVNGGAVILTDGGLR